jgi:6-phosphogluconolactonase (cycloisomerase 2 family)
MRTRFTLALTSLALAACADHGPASPTAPGAAVFKRDAAPAAGGAVFTMTNAAGGNEAVAFRRAADGTLSEVGRYATGGRGSGGTVDPLQSQYALRLDDAHARLFVVNAGSGDVTSFAVGSDGSLTLVDRASTGGTRPVSVALHGRLLYVLNRESSTVSGLRVNPHGKLQPIEHSTRALNGGAPGTTTGGSTAHFTPDGRYLAVTERLADQIELFPVLPNGRLGDGVITRSSGARPFGFDVTAGGQLVVSESRPPAAGGGAASSYAVSGGGALRTITASLPTDGLAACWVAITGDGRFAFVTNAASNTVARLALTPQAGLARLAPNVPTAAPGEPSTPIDLALSGDDRFVYVLEAAAGTIATFAVGADGALSARADTPAGTPASGMQGVAAY